jgi:hypothetical protein
MTTSKINLKILSMLNRDQGSEIKDAEMGWTFSSDKGHKKCIWSFGKRSIGRQLGRQCSDGSLEK